MKLRNYIIIVFLMVACCNISQAQKTPSLTHPRLESDGRLESIVRQARTQAITPHAAPPAWMDYEKARIGSAFLKKHREFIDQILATSSLSATFAARDITPLVLQTGRLPKDFSRRMNETGDLIDAIVQPYNSRDEFLTHNLADAYKLGLLHAEVAKQVNGRLHWNPKERVPMNQQSFGFVFYTFAWWPVEALAATGQINPVAMNKELEGWFHFWSVIGYEMGVSEALLPANFTRAKEIVALLRKAQYVDNGENVPDGIPVLLGGQVRWLVERTVAHSAAEKPAPVQKPTPEQILPGVIRMFAQTINLSPKLSESLGLGKDPAAQLTRYASIASTPPSLH